MLRPKIDILFFITCLAPNGAEFACLRLLQGLASENQKKLAVVSILDGSLYKSFKSLGVPVFVLFSSDWYNALKFLLLTLFRADITLVHAWLYHASFLSQVLFFFKRCHILVSVRQSLPNYKSLRPLTLLFAFASGFISRLRPSTIIFNSISGSEDHIRLLAYPKYRSIVIPNIPYFCDLPPLSCDTPFTSRVNILALARYDLSKNLTYMIKLFSLLVKSIDQPVHLTICGEGIPQNLTDIINQYDSSLSEHISLFSFSNNISQHILNSHIYMSTSLWEGYPNSLITAAASGCVPVCTSAGDSTKILTKDVFTLNGQLDHDLSIVISAISYVCSSTPRDRALNYRAQINSFNSNFSCMTNLYSSFFH